jgi:hypothetical protein
MLCSLDELGWADRAPDEVAILRDVAPGTSLDGLSPKRRKAIVVSPRPSRSFEVSWLSSAVGIGAAASQAKYWKAALSAGARRRAAESTGPSRRSGRRDRPAGRPSRWRPWLVAGPAVGFLAPMMMLTRQHHEDADPRG